MTTTIIREYTYLIDRATREKNPKLAGLLTAALTHHQEDIATRPDTNTSKP